MTIKLSKLSIYFLAGFWLPIGCACALMTIYRGDYEQLPSGVKAVFVVCGLLAYVNFVLGPTIWAVVKRKRSRGAIGALNLITLLLFGSCSLWLWLWAFLGKTEVKSE